jgi:hypothetical protein
MTKDKSVVAIFKSHAGAESAVKELQQSGFDMKKLVPRRFRWMDRMELVSIG